MVKARLMFTVVCEAGGGVIEELKRQPPPCREVFLEWLLLDVSYFILCFMSDSCLSQPIKEFPFTG